MTEDLRRPTPGAEKPVLEVSEDTKREIAAADMAYEAAHRPLYEEYSSALQMTETAIQTVKREFQPRFEALRTERTRAVRAAYAGAGGVRK